MNMDQKQIDEKIESVLRDIRLEHNRAGALGRLKSNAYLRLKNKVFLNAEYIKNEYRLISEKKSKLPSEERAFVAYVMNNAITMAINERIKLLKEEKDNEAKQDEEERP